VLSKMAKKMALIIVGSVEEAGCLEGNASMIYMLCEAWLSWVLRILADGLAAATWSVLNAPLNLRKVDSCQWFPASTMILS